MTNRALCALLLGVAPVAVFAQGGVPPGNASNAAGEGSNVAAGAANDSVDADTPADTTANTTDTADDGPPK